MEIAAGRPFGTRLARSQSAFFTHKLGILESLPKQIAHVNFRSKLSAVRKECLQPQYYVITTTYVNKNIRASLCVSHYATCLLLSKMQVVQQRGLVAEGAREQPLLAALVHRQEPAGAHAMFHSALCDDRLGHQYLDFLYCNKEMHKLTS